MRRLAAALLLSCAASLGSAFGQTDGRSLYMSKCSACHASDGSGNSTVGRSLGLRDIRPTIKTLTDEQLNQLIHRGRGKMPANKKLNDEQVASLTLFLRDLVAGNPDSGRAVAQAQSQPLDDVPGTYQAKCSACHGQDGTGRTTVGKDLKIPDLTSAAVRGRSDAELAEIISKGRGRMPAYAKKYNPVQVDEFVAYVRGLAESAGAIEPIASSIPPATPPGPPEVPAQMMAPPKSASPAPAQEASTTAKTTPESQERKAAKLKPVAMPPAEKAPGSGRKTYISKCSACHSRDGSGTGIIGRTMHIPSLTSPDVQGQSDEHLASIIANGAGKMPAYKKKYSPEEIRLLVSYIRELPEK